MADPAEASRGWLELEFALQRADRLPGGADEDHPFPAANQFRGQGDGEKRRA